MVGKVHTTPGKSERPGEVTISGPPMTSVSGAHVLKSGKSLLAAGSEAGTFGPHVQQSSDVLVHQASGWLMTSYPPNVSVTSTYSVAASTATSFDEAKACLAAEGVMRNLDLPLLRVLADDKDSATLREQLRLGAIEARVAQVLAAGELERRTDAKQDQKWVMDKWIVIAIAAGGWFVALAVALLR